MSREPLKRHWTERKGVIWTAGCLFFLFMVLGLLGMVFGRPYFGGSDWQALWAFLTLLVAVAAAMIALVQLEAHQRARRELSRPYVVVDFSFKSILLQLEVKNIGQTPARDVRLRWDIEPRALDDQREEALKRIFVDRAIPFLAPGREIRCTIGRSPDYYSDGSMPNRFEVVAEYSDSGGRPFGAGEVMILDLDQWAGSSGDEDYDNKNWNQLRWQTEAQRKIARAVESIDERLENSDSSARLVGEGLRSGETDGRKPRWWFGGRRLMNLLASRCRRADQAPPEREETA